MLMSMPTHSTYNITCTHKTHTTSIFFSSARTMVMHCLGRMVVLMCANGRNVGILNSTFYTDCNY